MIGRLGFVLVLAAAFPAAAAVPDDSPPRAGEWGFRPPEDEALEVTPPGFAWRPQKGAASYDLEIVGRGSAQLFEGIAFNVFCPDRALPAGSYQWRYRFRDGKGAASDWSRPRSFTVPEGAPEFPLPPRDALLARIPWEHPRLFLRPENVAGLRNLARGSRKREFDELVQACEKWLREPPDTAEPAKYPKGMARGSEEWRALWWGNREAVIRVLEPASTLGFTGLIAGRREFLDLARRILLDAARWDPRGATGYLYNDEAGMPFVYHFSRAYTFLHEALTEEERDACRATLKARGDEVYKHLCPRHLWRPYDSHSNRAWHKLGEAGIAFHGEVPGADDWVWFAANVFRCVYPVWSDDDGGWHEGLNYWRSYLGRFTWWADAMKAALGLDAFRMPYFSKAGYYPLYLQPPGQRGGGFGDLCENLVSKGNAFLASTLAAAARNPHWQWYAEANGGAPRDPGWIGFLRGTLPPVPARPPADLPSSRAFRGTGIAALNVTLLDASDNVQVLFKSSPFGTQSHGYDAQNAFLLNVAGEPLLVSSGTRDLYASEHHRNWMWETKSVNSATVCGFGQVKHSREARGEILEFRAGPVLDYVAGEAGGAYGGRLEAFTRRILFVKPDLVVLFDTLRAPVPSVFEWRLHANAPFRFAGPEDVALEGKAGAARIAFLAPEGLRLEQTDAFDPPPRPRVVLKQWHLTAGTVDPAFEKSFVVAVRPRRAAEPAHARVQARAMPGGFVLTGESAAGRVLLLLRTGDGELGDSGLGTEKRVAAWVFDDRGAEAASFESEEGMEEAF